MVELEYWLHFNKYSIPKYISMRSTNHQIEKLFIKDKEIKVLATDTVYLNDYVGYRAKVNKEDFDLFKSLGNDDTSTPFTVQDKCIMMIGF